MKIFVGIIAHRYGNNAYASRTEDELYGQLANYCREWWDDSFLHGVKIDADKNPPEDDFECVKMYFNNIGNEYLTTSTAYLG